MGFDTSDDACVYRITDEIAAIHTVDFFTPIVDDPFLYGQIAAANAISDVYAMGGRPAVAMNLLCVPGCLSQETIRKILEGGHQKAVEAGCVIAGGHTIQDDEPKYGLCVTGYVHPDKALRNVGARPGDALVLTKPLGTGVLTTAAKADLLEPEQYDRLVRSMARLNAHAAEAVSKCQEIHACTDVTGFGLLGHADEMARGSGVTIRLHGKAVRRNRKFLHGAGVFRCVICRRFRPKRFVRTACDHTAGQDGSAGIRQQCGAHRHPLRLRAGQSVLRSRDADGNAGNSLLRLPCRCLCTAGLRCRQCFFFAGSAHEKDQHCQYERTESLHCSVLLRFTFVDLS